ncbi:MAG TPA: hypothetical protein VHC69_30315 [Polyangiaceae bacterium]|nr:hypothetical protein [Polyangiaceae bacterium]
MPAVPTVQRRATAEALAERERALAQPNRSGVRAIAVEGPRVPDESGIDLSNAVTKVQPAIDLDAILLAQSEDAVVVRGTVSLDGPAAPPAADEITEKITVPAGPLAASVETARFDARHMSQLLADAKAAHEAAESGQRAESVQGDESAQQDDRVTTPPRRRSPLRKMTAALLVLAVMGGAFALLIVAASRAEGRLPSPVVHWAERVLALVRR